jgi:hypothetical protein
MIAIIVAPAVIQRCGTAASCCLQLVRTIRLEGSLGSQPAEVRVLVVLSPLLAMDQAAARQLGE